MGYNAVTTSFTKYVSVRWNYDLAAASRCLMVGTVAAVLSYLPVGMPSSRFGRKCIIQIGVIVPLLLLPALPTSAWPCMACSRWWAWHGL